MLYLVTVCTEDVQAIKLCICKLSRQISFSDDSHLRATREMHNEGSNQKRLRASSLNGAADAGVKIPASRSHHPHLAQCAHSEYRSVERVFPCASLKHTTDMCHTRSDFPCTSQFSRTHVERGFPSASLKHTTDMCHTRTQFPCTSLEHM